MRVRLRALAIWAVVAACVMCWALRLLVPTRPLPPHALVSGTPAPPRGDLGRVFGAAPAPSVPGAPVAVESSQATRFKLLGVAAPRQGGDRNGLALIAIDGKPARSVLVISIDAVFFQCSRALLRSRLWQPATWPDRATLPSTGCLLQQASAARADGQPAVDGAAYDRELPTRVAGSLS